TYGSLAISGTISVAASPSPAKPSRSTSGMVSGPDGLRFRRRGGVHGPEEGAPVRVVVHHAAPHDRPGETVVLRPADNVLRVAALLHSRDAFEHQLARLDDGHVRDTQVLPGAILDRAGALRHACILGLEDPAD